MNGYRGIVLGTAGPIPDKEFKEIEAILHDIIGYVTSKIEYVNMSNFIIIEYIESKIYVYEERFGIYIGKLQHSFVTYLSDPDCYDKVVERVKEIVHSYWRRQENGK